MSELETLRKRVAELEAAARRLISAWDSDTQRGITTAEDNLRALLAPREPIDIKPEDEAAVRAIFESGERTEETRVASTRTPSEDGTEPVADTRRSLPEGSTPSPTSSKFDIGGTVNFKREPKPCGKCGGSGSVWDGPAGVHISDGNAMKPCPACRGGEETK